MSKINRSEGIAEMEMGPASKQIQTGFGIVTIKFTATSTELRLERDLRPGLYDWDQIQDALMVAAEQACKAAGAGVSNYWDTFSNGNTEKRQ